MLCKVKTSSYTINFSGTPISIFSSVTKTMPTGDVEFYNNSNFNFGENGTYQIYGVLNTQWYDTYSNGLVIKGTIGTNTGSVAQKMTGANVNTDINISFNVGKSLSTSTGLLRIFITSPGNYSNLSTTLKNFYIRQITRYIPSTSSYKKIKIYEEKSIGKKATAILFGMLPTGERRDGN